MRHKRKKETATIQRVQYLKKIKSRMENEVGTYFDMLTNYNKLELRKIGFWSTIRLLMPIVETTAKTLGKTPQEILHQMDVKTPHLVWEMFRHPLIHGDQLSHIKYKDREINWGLTLGSGKGVSHIIMHDHIGLDLNYLYSRLLTLLSDEISKNDETIIKIEVGIIFDDDAPSYILDDLKKIE